MAWRERLRPTLTREIGFVFVALAAVGAAAGWLVHVGRASPGVCGGLAAAAAGLVAWGLWAVEHRVAAPVRRLGDAARRVGSGDFSVRAREEGLYDELADVARAFNEMSDRLKDTLAVLEAERSFQRVLIERLPEAVVVVDTVGRIIFHNTLFTAYFDGAQPLLKQKLGAVLPMSGLAALVEKASRFRREIHEMESSWSIKNSGSSRHLKIFAHAVYDSSQAPDRVVIVFEDVSRAVAARRARKAWRDMLIHDVKSPLTAVMAAVKTAREAVDPEHRTLLDIADRGAEKIMEMLQSYLQVLRMESGALKAEREDVALGALIGEVLAGVRGAAERRKLRLGVDGAGGGVIRADRELLRRMLTNLLDNAIKFSREGGEAGVRLRRKERGLQIEVWDRGKGIPEEDLPHVFDRFYRADSAKRDAGSGIGLAFCKLACDLHRWRITVRAEEGLGTSVRLHVPGSDIAAQ